MSEYKFNDHERFAIFVTHGEKCYLCNRALNLRDMVVDHVIPETLLNSTSELKKVLSSFGLPSDFDLNSYANWLPACGACNLKKSSIVFNPTPLIQICLQQAAKKIGKAMALAIDSATRTQITRALNLLLRADAEGNLDKDTRAALAPLVQYQIANREPEQLGKPVRLTRLYEVVQQDAYIEVVHGPYGIGGGPRNASSAMRCGSCGYAYFNGARCVICGAMED